MASNTIKIGEGENTDDLISKVELLKQQGWSLDNEGIGIFKEFHFKRYVQALVSTDPIHNGNIMN